MGAFRILFEFYPKSKDRVTNHLTSDLLQRAETRPKDFPMNERVTLCVAFVKTSTRAIREGSHSFDADQFDIMRGTDASTVTDS